MYKINCVQEAASYKPVWLCTRQLVVLFLSGVGGEVVTGEGGLSVKRPGMLMTKFE